MSETTAITPEQLDAMIEALNSGLPVSEVVGVSQETIETGYGLAFSLYNSGNFKDAETIFQALCLYNHQDERFWMGLAGCRQANGDLDNAIEAYGVATVMDALRSPAPSFHAGLCYLKKGDKENARALFDGAVSLGDPQNPEHKACQERAQAMLDLIDKGGAA